ncbi:hypothetical protein Tco_0566119 [Tanacetum coccineum]
MLLTATNETKVIYARLGADRSGQGGAPTTRECTFARFMNECADGKKVKFAFATLQGPALTWWNSKVATMGLEARFNELALMCLRMVNPKSVKVDAYIRGLSKNIKGDHFFSKPTTYKSYTYGAQVDGAKVASKE